MGKSRSFFFFYYFRLDAVVSLLVKSRPVLFFSSISLFLIRLPSRITRYNFIYFLRAYFSV
jgi:hypothetical protein